MSDVLIPVDRFRPIVERWLAEHEVPVEAYRTLEGASTITADAWRRRLTEDCSGGRIGWFFPVALDFYDVDEFLTAAGLTHLWQTDLRDLLPEPRLSDEEFDETCAECSRWIDWSRGDAGIRVEVKRPRRWTLWWSLCSLCACDQLYIPPRQRDEGGRYPARRVPEQTIRDLYRRYVLEQIGAATLAGKVYEELGFPSAGACNRYVVLRWKAAGFPMRGREESKRLNRKHGHRWTHRMPRRALEQAHVLHVRGDLSMNELGRRLYRQYGYASHTSCAMAISAGWRLLGLEARDRIEMVVVTTTKHGQCRRNTRRALRRSGSLPSSAARRTGLKCAAKTTRGLPCGRTAPNGKTLCYNHDPDRAADRAAVCERLRVNSPFDPANTVPFDDVPARLRAWFEANGRKWKPMTVVTGKSNTSLLHFAAKEPVDRTMPDTKALLERALDELAHDLRQRDREAA